MDWNEVSNKGFLQEFSIFLAIIWSFLVSNGVAAELPFWKAKPEVYQKIVEQKRVFVSVTSVDGEKGSHEKHMKLSGGGQIRAPKDFAVERILDFEKSFQHSDFIKSVQVDSKHHSLFIHAVAYGFSNSMKVNWSQKKEGSGKTLLSFEVQEGIMKGFQWTLSFEKALKNRTDVGVDGDYNYEKFPMPAFFLRFGLEVVFQKLAIQLRSYVEEEYNKVQKSKGGDS